MAAFAELVLWQVPNAVQGSHHAFKYRLAYVEKSQCRVLFDNHAGKKDHFHRDGEEFDYLFRGVSKLRQDFEAELRKMGAQI